MVLGRPPSERRFAVYVHLLNIAGSESLLLCETDTLAEALAWIGTEQRQIRHIVRRALLNSRRTEVAVGGEVFDWGDGSTPHRWLITPQTFAAPM